MSSKPIRPIPDYDDINAHHAATGYSGRTDLKGFHIFTLEDTYPSTRPVMTPHTINFYQLMLLEESQDAVIELNAERFSNNSSALFFGVPGQVSAWIRGEAQKGFIVYFKEDFLNYPRTVREEFPFFRPTEINMLSLGKNDQTALGRELENLLQTFQRPHPYRVHIIQSLLLAVLFECKGLSETYNTSAENRGSKEFLAFRFQNLLEQRFLTHHTVQEYAALLNVSPNHLSAVVSAVLGKTAHALIAERIVLEARKLLNYSDLSISQIAFYLGFEEPTHFTRYFKKHTDYTPMAFRLNRRA